MGNDNSLKIVLASSGRRAHYIQWFQDALDNQGIDGEVIAMEYRATSPSLGLADRVVLAPAYNSPDYPDALRDWFTTERPDLFFCMNDYELQILSDGLADDLRGLGCAVTVLDAAAQAVVLDKYRMAQVLHENGIPTPVTYLGTDVDAVVASSAADSEFVVKHRFGSGSSGLLFPTAADLTQAVARSASTALGKDGRVAQNGPDAVIIQPRLPGSEYGVDGVFSVDGQSQLLGVLARRVDLMRDGDPDVATTVSPEPFHQALNTIGNLFHPSGSFNVDFRETADGQPQVIDINPRLGGGYPYCHRAGADMPSALIRSAAGLEHIPSLLEYEHGITTARREEFTVINQPVRVGSR